MIELLTLIASVIATACSVTAIFISLSERKRNKQFAQTQLEALNFNNRLVHETLKEAQKSPNERKADELARRGGFSTHAAYLERSNIGFREFRLEDDNR